MSVKCYNCSVDKDGPVCGRCWEQLSWDAREDIKNVFNDDVSEGKHGVDVQLFCDVPGCWNLVKKKQATWSGRCFEHPEDAPRDRSRSPVVRPADRPGLRPADRRVASAASSHRPAIPPTADRMRQGIARLRAGLEMMQNAVNHFSGITVIAF